MRVSLPPPFEETLAEAALSVDLAHEALARRLEALETLDLWDCPYAVVDIETTGGVAGTHAMTEIAVVRVDQGRIVSRWRSFVNPLQPIPRFITQLTGITDEMVAGAPHVREILPAVMLHLGDAIVVGHNVRFDASFIDFELRRHGYAGISSPTLDTLALARRTIAEVANYKLGTLTRELGLDVERHHRALADATATAELLVHCVKRLEDAGVFTFGALQQYLRTRPIKRKRAARSRAFGEVSQLPVWTSVLTTELASVPSKPGVYLLKDAGGAVVYVGKSNALRARVRAYATTAKPAGAKIRELRGVVASFDYLVTGSEFEALLLRPNSCARSTHPTTTGCATSANSRSSKSRPGRADTFAQRPACRRTALATTDRIRACQPRARLWPHCKMRLACGPATRNIRNHPRFPMVNTKRSSMKRSHSSKARRTMCCSRSPAAAMKPRHATRWTSHGAKRPGSSVCADCGNVTRAWNLRPGFQCWSSPRRTIRRKKRVFCSTVDGSRRKCDCRGGFRIATKRAVCSRSFF